MKIGLNRIGRDKLVFDPSLLNKTTSNYTKLQETAYNGVDRMLMQSDLRDIYHSIEIIGFNKTKENGITGKLFIQLSENTNEKKLRETVKKYLRMSNYNLGGTELYANPLVTDLETYDFDECAAEDVLNSRIVLICWVHIRVAVWKALPTRVRIQFIQEEFV